MERDFSPCSFYNTGDTGTKDWKIPSNPIHWLSCCRLPIQSFLFHMDAIKHIRISSSKRKGCNKKVKSHNCDVHSTLDWDFVWLDSQIITETGYPEREKSLLHFSWQESLLTWKYIIKQLPGRNKRDVVCVCLVGFPPPRCFSCEEDYILDGFQLFSSVLSFPMSILLTGGIYLACHLPSESSLAQTPIAFGATQI